MRPSTQSDRVLGEQWVESRNQTSDALMLMESRKDAEQGRGIDEWMKGWCYLVLVVAGPDIRRPWFGVVSEKQNLFVAMTPPARHAAVAHAPFFLPWFRLDHSLLLFISTLRSRLHTTTVSTTESEENRECLLR